MNQADPDMWRRDGGDDAVPTRSISISCDEGIYMKASIRSVALIDFLALVLAACSSRAEGPTATTAGNGTSTTVPETSSPLSAAELGELFRQALNSGDVAAAAPLAPIITNEDLQDVIRMGPYDTVDCVVLQGRDVCDISNEGTPHEFVLGLSTGLVTEIFYTGGG